jgi:prophage regulatory protein
VSEENPPKLLSREDLKRFGINYSDVQLRRLESAGKFPKRVHLPSRRCMWVESEIVEYINQCIRRRG